MPNYTFLARFKLSYGAPEPQIETYRGDRGMNDLGAHSPTPCSRP